MRPTRTSLLVHWTGRGLPDPATSEGKTQYVDRLKSICIDGLYLNCPDTEDILRSVQKTDRRIPRLPCVCFTEVRIHEAFRFARDYGRLGVGFRREYLLKYGFNPVFYLRSANHGIANTNISALPDLVTKSNQQAADVILAYCKPMNEVDEPELKYYEEHEWRIVYAPGGIPLPREFVTIPRPDGRRTPAFQFDWHEVTLLVFPNAEIRAKAISDKDLRMHFERHTPMMLDFDLCSEL